MGSGLGHPDLALYRSIKAGETGLNLSLSDLIDRRIELPSLYDIIKSFFTKEKIIIIMKAYPNRIIERIHAIQRGVDKKIEWEIEKAKRGST